MPNHFHLMIQTHCVPTSLRKDIATENRSVSEALRRILSSYKRIVNARRHRSGSVFRQGTKHKCLDDSNAYGANRKFTKNSYHDCFLYIHRNPLKSGLVYDLKDWEFSSYLEFAGFRKGSLVDAESVLAYLDIGSDYFRSECRRIG